MIKTDFVTYLKRFIEKDKYDELYNKKELYIDKLNNSYMNGWTKEIDTKVVDDIKNTSSYIKNNFDTLVVIGIGGSYMGSHAFHSMFKKYFNDESFNVIYVGYTLSSKYIDELLLYLNDKNFCINVVGKSGNTMETIITYKTLKDLLKRKYSTEEVNRRIIITTNNTKGYLFDEIKNNGYKSFWIDDNIGGRFSFMTPAHLLPLSLNYDIDEIIDGYYDGKRFIDKAFEYAAIRKLLYDKGKVVEAFAVCEENLLPFTEWLKQLFAESEGKNSTGILPISLLYTRDLHSLGQFIQDGSKILFETFIKINNKTPYIEYNNMELSTINNKTMESVMMAHNEGNVAALEIEIDELTPENVAFLIYFFQLSATFSAMLFNQNPFDQPGVEVYKSKLRDMLEL